MKINIATSLLLAASSLLASTGETVAQSVPPLINYQGRLVNSNGVPVSTGDYELRFRIWDAATNGNLIWGPQIFNGQGGPGFGPLVPVVQGWFNVILGPTATNGVSIASAFTSTNRFVEIQAGTNASFSPRQQVLSAPYALRAAFADTATVAQTAVYANTALTSSNLLGLATADSLTYYVSTNGEDRNDGLTTNTPKRTIQAAIDLVPSQIKHHTYIRIFPGVYRELVRIIRKELFSPNASLQLIGMGTDASAVRVSGADAFGSRARAMALHVFEGIGTAFNMTFEECTDTGVAVLHHSDFGFTQCNFWNFNGEMALEGYSTASFENCYFQRFDVRGSVAISVESKSYCAFRNDHLIPPDNNSIPGFVGDPNNSLINTFNNFTLGVRARGGSVVVTTGALNFTNVTTLTATIQGGQVF